MTAVETMPIVRDDVATKELARRRVFAFFSVFLLIALFSTLIEESGTPMYALDDYIIIAIAIIAILVMAVSWNKRNVSQLRKQHNVLAILVAIALIVQIFGIIMEFHGSADLGNEIPVFILLVVMLANRFL